MSGNEDQPSAERPVALEARDQTADGRRFSPSVARNREAIAGIFALHMPCEGRLLEIASGTGEHGAHITSACARLEWWYSDIDRASLDSQEARKAHPASPGSLRGPLHIDVTLNGWMPGGPQLPLDAIFCANMIHIAPFAACQGLLEGAGRLLRSGGRLMLYGPFARDGVMAESNARFDTDLKCRNPDWGVRDLERDLLVPAEAVGLFLVTSEPMPANNCSVVFERR